MSYLQQMQFSHNAKSENWDGENIYKDLISNKDDNSSCGVFDDGVVALDY